ncbi:unnamed protein product, partial [Scytosiphon promiscuus]
VSTQEGLEAGGVVWRRASLEEVQEFVALVATESASPQQHGHQQQGEGEGGVTVERIRTFFRGWLEPDVVDLYYESTKDVRTTVEKCAEIVQQVTHHEHTAAGVAPAASRPPASSSSSPLPDPTPSRASGSASSPAAARRARSEPSAGQSGGGARVGGGGVAGGAASLEAPAGDLRVAERREAARTARLEEKATGMEDAKGARAGAAGRSKEDSSAWEAAGRDGGAKAATQARATEAAAAAQAEAERGAHDAARSRVKIDPDITEVNRAKRQEAFAAAAAEAQERRARDARSVSAAAVPRAALGPAMRGGGMG